MNAPEVVVAVATYRRPGGVRAVVPALLAQVESLADARARVVVVDNDPDAAARESVAPFVGDLLSYAHEPRPGIAAARNRALDEAADADAVVFIDDDELPCDGWLEALVRTWREHGCAGVAGPVIFEPAEPLDAWVTGARIFATIERSTGTPVPGASSANLLLDLSTLRSSGTRFDEAYGLTGGSDTKLTHALTDRGHALLWCAEAVVREDIPASRLTHSWVFTRTLRTSNCWGRVQIEKATSRRDELLRRGRMAGKGSARLLRGAGTRLLARSRRDDGADGRGAVDVASGLGMLSSAVGIVRSEYHRPA